MGSLLYMYRYSSSTSLLSGLMAKASPHSSPSWSKSHDSPFAVASEDDSVGRQVAAGRQSRSPPPAACAGGRFEARPSRSLPLWLLRRRPLKLCGPPNSSGTPLVGGKVLHEQYTLLPKEGSVKESRAAATVEVVGGGTAGRESRAPVLGVAVMGRKKGEEGRGRGSRQSVL
jgi:hypothetical protein